MIEGLVNPAYEPIIPLRLFGVNDTAVDVSAVVDTGFSGFLTLPPQMIAELDAPFAYFGGAILADDSEVSFDVHYVTISWNGGQEVVEAAASGSTPLVGMMLLGGCELNIDVRQGGRVLIQAAK